MKTNQEIQLPTSSTNISALCHRAWRPSLHLDIRRHDHDSFCIARGSKTKNQNGHAHAHARANGTKLLQTDEQRDAMDYELHALDTNGAFQMIEKSVASLHIFVWEENLQFQVCFDL